MFDLFHQLADELTAALITISGLHQIQFYWPPSDETFGKFCARFSSWPESLKECISRYDGIRFLPSRGGLYSCASVFALYDTLDSTGILESKLAVFGDDGQGSYWAIPLASGAGTGPESVIRVPQVELLPGGILNPFPADFFPAFESTVFAGSLFAWERKLVQAFTDQAGPGFKYSGANRRR
jgi:hypothetical protein